MTNAVSKAFQYCQETTLGKLWRWIPPLAWFRLLHVDAPHLSGLPSLTILSPFPFHLPILLAKLFSGHQNVTCFYSLLQPKLSIIYFLLVNLCPWSFLQHWLWFPGQFEQERWVYSVGLYLTITWFSNGTGNIKYWHRHLGQWMKGWDGIWPNNWKERRHTICPLIPGDMARWLFGSWQMPLTSNFPACSSRPLEEAQLNSPWCWIWTS